jgi:vitamin B12 transporter
MTYRLGNDSILRATASRGFTIPPFSFTSGTGLGFDPNPSLDAEEVWSFQTGIESAAAKYFWTKATLFWHELDNALTAVLAEVDASEDETDKFKIFNKGKVRRRGFELEVETLPIYNVSLSAGFTYVDLDPSNELGSEGIYASNVGIEYDDKKSFRAELFGRYVWWDLDRAFEAKYDDFIWDLNLSKQIPIHEEMAAQLFFTAHNLFQGSQYTLGDRKNPGRWVEAGIRFKF